MENKNYTPTPLFQSEQQPQSNIKKSESVCRSISCWIFTIISWIIILFIIYIFVPIPDITWESCNKFTKICHEKNLKNELSKKYIYIGIPFYVIYLVLEFTSPTYKFLFRKNNKQTLYEVLGSLFQARPYIYVSCSCYHFETETYTTTDSEGNSQTETRTITVTTYSETQPINYYSYRDISGLFILNVNEKKIGKKAYIKLEIKEEINYADSISYNDMMLVKEDMTRRNEKRDDYFSINEIRKIIGIQHHYFIRLFDKEPKCFNHYWFILFTFLTMGQFYKRYVSSLSVYQNFTIRKVMSTRYDLSDEESNIKYEKFNPQMNIMTQNLSFPLNKYTDVSIINKKALPTEEEIMEAKKYENMSPKYEINTEADIGRTGTVKDIPYNNYYQGTQNNQENYSEKNEKKDNVNIPMITIDDNITNENK